MALSTRPQAAVADEKRKTATGKPVAVEFGANFT